MIDNQRADTPRAGGGVNRTAGAGPETGMIAQRGHGGARVLRGGSEAIILAMVCLAPWAFGAVEAWAELGLYVGIGLTAVPGALAAWTSDRPGPRACLPGLALAGLTLLALAQAAPQPEPLLRRVAPATAALRSRLLPGVAERVSGDPGPPVPLPAPTISQDPEASINQAARLAAAWILFQSVLGLGGGLATLRRFGLALVGNCTLLALFSLIQLASWNGKIYWLRPTHLGNGGPFVSHNHLAAYLNLGLGFAMGFLLGRDRDGHGSRRRGAFLWAAYAAGLIVAGVVASLSRGGFVALVVAMTTTLLVARPRALRLVAGLVAGVALVLAFLTLLDLSAPHQRLATLLDATPYAGRMEVWRDALRAWRIHPAWGVGLGAFPAGTMPFFRRDQGVTFFHAENEYVEMLVEGGIVGLGLAILGLVATARLGRRALRSASRPRDRGLILGALFGGIALATQCVSDFPLHIPAIAITAVVLGAHLSRLGLRDPGPPGNPQSVLSGRARPALAGLATVAVALVLAAHGLARARAEIALMGTGIPQPGAVMPAAGFGTDPKADLDRMRASLEHALRHRPDWAEGHLRLGLVLLGQYERTVAEWIAAGQPADPSAASRMAGPLWLHGVAHDTPADRRPGIDVLLQQEPIRRYLVPAARSFLEARRCCPTAALAHAELATLDYLIEGSGPAPVHAARALELAGSDGLLAEQVAQVAAQAGDLDLAARGWHKALDVSEAGWAEVADLAGSALPPDRILDQVVTRGRHALWFAGRLYAAPADRRARERFLRAAAERLPRDRDIPEAERLQLEAQAWADLGDLPRARDRMAAALALEPRHAAWRAELIGWLLERGLAQEAHDQALIGLSLTPDDPEARRSLERSADALARGDSGARTGADRGQGKDRGGE